MSEKLSSPLSSEDAEERFAEIKKKLHKTPSIHDKDPDDPQYSGSDHFPWLAHPDRNKKFQEHKKKFPHLYKD